MAPYLRPLNLRSSPARPRRWRGVVLPAVVFVGVFAGALVDWTGPIDLARTLIAQADPPLMVDQAFSGCDAARAAGRENIPSWDPSYRARMDGDGDGLACEPYRR